MYLRCPQCHGLLNKENDGFEDFLICIMCAREFKLDLSPRITSTFNLVFDYGINLPSNKNYGSMVVE